jgi:hypothetical protein
MMAAQKEAGMSPVLASIARVKAQAREKASKKRADSRSSADPPKDPIARFGHCNK